MHAPQYVPFSLGALDFHSPTYLTFRAFSRITNPRAEFVFNGNASKKRREANPPKNSIHPLRKIPLGPIPVRARRKTSNNNPKPHATPLRATKPIPNARRRRPKKIRPRKRQDYAARLLSQKKKYLRLREKRKRSSAISPKSKKTNNITTP